MGLAFGKGVKEEQVYAGAVSLGGAEAHHMKAIRDQRLDKLTLKRMMAPFLRMAH